MRPGRMLAGSQPVAELHGRVEEIVVDHIARIPDLVDDFVAGAVELF